MGTCHNSQTCRSADRAAGCLRPVRRGAPVTLLTAPHNVAKLAVNLAGRREDVTHVLATGGAVRVATLYYLNNRLLYWCRPFD